MVPPATSLATFMFAFNIFKLHPATKVEYIEPNLGVVMQGISSSFQSSPTFSKEGNMLLL